MMPILTEATGSIAPPPELAMGITVNAARQSSLIQLSNLLVQIQSATCDAEMLVLSHNQADLTTSMESGSWSVAECFDHLAQTTRAFLPAIAEAIALAPALETNRPLRTGTLAALFIRNLEPPYRLRLKVLPQLAPQHKDFETAWSGFMESQSQLLQTVRSATGLAIDKVKLKSPVYARISYNIYGAFRILATHERRHLWQAKQIIKELETLKRTPIPENIK